VFDEMCYIGIGQCSPRTSRCFNAIYATYWILFICLWPRKNDFCQIPMQHLIVTIESTTFKIRLWL